MSPQIVWSGAPAATRSYAVTLFDPDAHPGGGRDGWWHWVVIDIPLNVHQLATGAGSGAVPLPLGARQTVSDFGTTTYGGPCPPAGEDHRYIATVYALKVDKLDLPGNLPPAEVKAQLDAHMLASVQVEARAAR